VKQGAAKNPSVVLSLAQLLAEQPAEPPPGWIEPGLLPPQGILFVGGEPKVGKSLLVANLALALAAGEDRAGFTVPACRRVLVCQFELPVAQFVSRLAAMRRSLGAAADQNLLVDTRAVGHLLSAPQGLNHFLVAAREASAEVIVLDPLYSTHDQDENDTRSMAALCQSLLRLRDASRAALIVVHHVRKSIGRDEIGRAFRGSSALHAVGDSYLLLDAAVGESNRSRAALSVSLRRTAGATAARTGAAVVMVFRRRRGLPSSPPPKGRTRGCDPCPGWHRQSGAPQPTARPDHVRYGVLKAHRATGDSGSLPERRHCAGQRPIPAAAIGVGGLAVAAVRSGSRPGGCPGPMRRSGSEEIGSPPPAFGYGRGRVLPSGAAKKASRDHSGNLVR
jgi:hypothetical protein